MKMAGFVHVARSGISACIRAVGAWLADVTALTADLIDPDMPETIWRPREWMPRLWSRTDMRGSGDGRG